MKLEDLNKGLPYVDRAGDPWAWNRSLRQWCFLDSDGDWVPWPGEDVKGEMEERFPPYVIDVAFRRRLGALLASDSPLDEDAIEGALDDVLNDLVNFPLGYSRDSPPT